MLDGDEPYPHLHPYNHESEVSIHTYTDPGLRTATASLLITVSING